MFGIMLSAINAFAGWLFKSVIFKFILMFTLWFAVTELVPTLVPFLPSSVAIHSAISGVSPSVAYFLNLFLFDMGISLVVSAYAARFLIRRIPVIG